MRLTFTIRFNRFIETALFKRWEELELLRVESVGAYFPESLCPSCLSGGREWLTSHPIYSNPKEAETDEVVAYVQSMDVDELASYQNLQKSEHLGHPINLKRNQKMSGTTKKFLVENFANIAIALSVIFLIFELNQNRRMMERELVFMEAQAYQGRAELAFEMSQLAFEYPDLWALREQYSINPRLVGNRHYRETSACPLSPHL